MSFTLSSASRASSSSFSPCTGQKSFLRLTQPHHADTRLLVRVSLTETPGSQTHSPARTAPAGHGKLRCSPHETECPCLDSKSLFRRSDFCRRVSLSQENYRKHGVEHEERGDVTSATGSLPLLCSSRHFRYSCWYLRRCSRLFPSSDRVSHLLCLPRS